MSRLAENGTGEGRARVRPAFLPAREVMSVMDAIYVRRSVRQFTDEIVPEATIYALLYAAVQAPSARDEQPWGFAVVQKPQLLQEISDASGLGKAGSIFHNAGTLIVIYNWPENASAFADSWLAAANIGLAACGMGLASCIIGSATDVLNTHDWKARLDIPAEMQAVAPIVIGMPVDDGAVMPRRPLEILAWVKST